MISLQKENQKASQFQRGVLLEVCFATRLLPLRSYDTEGDAV